MRRRQQLSSRMIVTIALVLVAPTLMQSTAAAGRDADLTYLRAGRMIDVVDGGIVTDAAIIVRNGIIERLGKAADVSPPDGAQIIDLGDATVLPCLIDVHAHLTSDHLHHGYGGLAVSVARQALYGAANARRTLEAGFTTVRNLGASGYTDVALRDAIADGDLPGPRMLVSGPALGITGGHCDSNLLPVDFGFTAEGVADGPWAARAKVREVVKYGANLVKFCATGGVLSKGDSVGGEQYTLEEMRAIVEEAHRHEIRVAAHAHGAQGIKTAIRAGVDSIEHASLIDEEGIELAKQHGTRLSMDVYVSDFILQEGEAVGILPESLAKEMQVGEQQRENFHRAHEAGARIVFGTDAGVYPHGDNAKQFAYMVRYGMTPMEAIQAATIHAAELLGWGDRVGAIAAGYHADMVAVGGDPLAQVELLEDIRFVMKGGEVILSDLPAGRSP